MSASTIPDAKPVERPRKVWVLRGNPGGGPFHDGDFCEGFTTKKEAVAAAKALGHNVNKFTADSSMAVWQYPDAGGTIMLSPAARRAFPDCEGWLRDIGEVCAELDPDIDLGGLWIHVVKLNTRNGDRANGIACSHKLSGNGWSVSRFHTAGEIEIRISDAPDMAEFIEVVAHEMRHIGQFKRGSSSRTMGLQGSEYFGHPAEIDARKFSMKVCQEFGVKPSASTTVAKLSGVSIKLLKAVSEGSGESLDLIEHRAHLDAEFRARLDEFARQMTDYDEQWEHEFNDVVTEHDFYAARYGLLVQHVCECAPNEWPAGFKFPTFDVPASGLVS